MTETLLKILVVIVILFILYLSFQTSRVKEGLTNSDLSSTTTSSSSTTAPPGLAGSASSYASSISNKVTQLSDSLLISKYNSDYVNVIDTMQNYINALSLELILSIDASDLANNNISSTLETLNIYNNAQNSLNNVLKFINANS
jgi:hypothetical protein